MIVSYRSQEFPSNIIAGSDVTAYQIPIQELQKLLSSNVDLARKFYFTIAWKNARRFKRRLERNPMRMSKDVTRKAVTKHIEVDVCAFGLIAFVLIMLLGLCGCLPR